VESALHVGSTFLDAVMTAGETVAWFVHDSDTIRSRSASSGQRPGKAGQGQGQGGDLTSRFEMVADDYQLPVTPGTGTGPAPVAEKAVTKPIQVLAALKTPFLTEKERCAAVAVGDLAQRSSVSCASVLSTHLSLHEKEQGPCDKKSSTRIRTVLLSYSKFLSQLLCTFLNRSSSCNDALNIAAQAVRSRINFETMFCLHSCGFGSAETFANVYVSVGGSRSACTRCDDDWLAAVKCGSCLLDDTNEPLQAVSSSFGEIGSYLRQRNNTGTSEIERLLLHWLKHQLKCPRYVLIY
jgi:hypothetical protein